MLLCTIFKHFCGRTLLRRMLKMLQKSIKDFLKTFQNRIKSAKEEITKQDVLLQELVEVKKEVKKGSGIIAKISQDVKKLKETKGTAAPSMKMSFMNQNSN